jgi:hypothetical protein
VATLSRAYPKVQPVSEHARDRQAATEPGGKGQLHVSGSSEGEDFEEYHLNSNRCLSIVPTITDGLPSLTTITNHHH